MLMADIFPFERLAAELRIKIYKELLVASSPIRIRHQRRKPQDGLRNSAVPIGSIITANGANDLREFLPALEANATNVLRLNKAILAEALPVLYGENTFIIYHHNYLRSLARTIGDNGRYVRHLKVDLCNAQGPSVPLWPIHPMARIRTLEFCIRPDYDRLQMVIGEALWHCMRKFVERGTDEMSRRENFAAVSVSMWHRSAPTVPDAESWSTTHEDGVNLLADMRSRLEAEGVLERVIGVD